LRQKGVSYKHGQNEYLFQRQAINTVLGAICGKMQCNMPQNAVRFGAKCSAFWCKTQCKMVLNAGQNGAKCKAKSINIYIKMV